MNTEFEQLLDLLGKRADDPEVRQFLEGGSAQVLRSAHQGYTEFKDVGLSVMFKEAQWVIPSSRITDPTALHLNAFHFHSKGHEGYSQYRGQLPGRVAFGDSEQGLIGKLGQPLAKGGGGFSATLRKPIPRWLKYRLGNAVLHFQLDAEGKVDMATLYLEDQIAKQ